MSQSMSRRAFLRSSAAAVSLGFLAACTAVPAGQQQTGSEGGATQESYELRVHTRTGNDLDAYFATVLDQFKEIVPEATVKMEAVPGGALEYAAKVLTLHAGGQMGDAVWSASRVGFNRRFMAVGILQPLDPYIEAESFDINQYYPNCIAEATYEGQIMALPHISEPGQIGLGMNLDLFEQAGVEPITFESSLDDLLNAAIQIKEATGTLGFARPNDYFNWVTHVRSFGGDFLDPEGTRCVLDEKALAAFQNLYDMVYELEIAPTPAQVAENTISMFQGGSLASASIWPIQASSWPTAIEEFEVSSTMLPPGPVARGSMLNQHMMSVAAASQHGQAAWEWVKWTCSAEFSIERALAGKGGPVGIPEVWHHEEILNMFPSWREWAAVMDEVGPNYTAANLRGKELEDAFNQGVSAIMVQEVGVEEGFERLISACQEILDRPIAL
jgi:ABC-type glycerol-3-phosphate transport system substrate-binding protein